MDGDCISNRGPNKIPVSTPRQPTHQESYSLFLEESIRSTAGRINLFDQRDP